MRKLSKILVLVLALAMLFTMASMFTASAANILGGTKLYLVPNANWNQGSARFAAYFFGDGEAWVSMTKVAGETNLYEVTVPAGKNFTNVIFCRMNPSASANNWNNKWNQTADLTYNGTSNCYTVKEGTWDKGGGTWSTYGSSCLHTNLGEEATCTTPQVCLDCGDPVVSALGHAYNSAHLCTVCNTQASFTVAGSGVHLGTEWDTGNTANDMTYADGVYTKVYTNVAAGSYNLKVARDHDWGTAYPSADKAYTVATTGSTVTVTLKGTTVTITVEAPHVHEFVDGKCECGAEDPNYVPPHTHVWSEATCTEPQKCECGETQGEALGHTPADTVEENRVEATCTEKGHYDSVVYCSVCKAELSREEVEIPVIAHTEETVAAKDPTCTETGLTEGKKCSVCGEILVEQTEVPALGHDIVADEAKAPTCTETGLTAGEHCSRCDHKIAQEEVPALGHDIVADEAKAPTCTETGLTAGEHCSRCDQKIAQEEVPALGHDIVADEAKAPTCTETGLTTGEHCSRCDHKVAQEEVPALGHTFVDGECECGAKDPEYVAPQPEPELNFFQKIIAWFMDLINKLLGIFKK